MWRDEVRNDASIREMEMVCSGGKLNRVKGEVNELV